MTRTILVILMGFAVLMTPYSSFAQLGPGDTHIGTPSPAPAPKPQQVYPFPEPIPPNPLPPAAESESVDRDPDRKAGGKDPIVFGDDWWYHEVSTEKCQSPRVFDFDNDGWKENFCYEAVGGDIFVVDFGNGISNGASMLNFDNTVLQWYSPIGYLRTFPDLCSVYDCYLWNDSTRDWVAEPDELTPFSFDIQSVTDHPNGTMHDNGRYVYCEGITTEGEQFYCLQPTYWEKGH